jgi:ADP-ribose pyrophosphatase
MTKSFKPWKMIDRRTVFAGGPVTEIAVESVLLPDGRIISDYYQIRLADFALVYAEMPDGRVPMLRQYKHGVQRVCLAFPGGALEPGESPLAAAQRELREELGCVAERWVSLGAMVMNGNQRCNRAHLFRAEVVTIVAPPASDDLEDAEIVYFDPAMLNEPEQVHGIGQAAHVALLFMAQHVRYSAEHS